MSLTPIFVNPGEDPILLNMIISAAYHSDKYFEMYIAVEPDEIFKFLQVEIVESSYSVEYFNFTFYVCDETAQEIESATIQMWWNGVDVSSDVQNLGNGLYFISLESIIITPGEEPILLTMIISASGYEDKSFETYIAVDPALLLKGERRPSDGFPLALTIILSAIGAGAIIGVISIYWFKRRKRKSE